MILTGYSKETKEFLKSLGLDLTNVTDVDIHIGVGDPVTIAVKRYAEKLPIPRMVTEKYKIKYVDFGKKDENESKLKDDENEVQNSGI